MNADPLSAYAGVLFLGLLMAATAVLWLRDRARDDDAMSRKQTDRRALVFLACASPPWPVMALGNIVGQIHDPRQFVNPQRGVFAVLFIGTLIWAWAALLYWLFAGGGAEELSESGHMALIGPRVRTPAVVKAVFVVCVAGAIGTLWWAIAHVQ